MKVSSFFKNLDTVSEDNKVAFKTPDGKFIPFHFHVTEAATINKKFRDCGGVERNENYASIQLWVANDFDHRINAGKIRKIILSTLIENEMDMDLVVEYETDTLSTYNIDSVEIIKNTLVYSLIKKKTECLAPDKCGITAPKKPCCGGNKCG
jgi:hypothetical protein